jgi:hypothetical protein
MHKADAVHPLDWHERMCVEKALRAYVTTETQLAAVREFVEQWSRLTSRQRANEAYRGMSSIHSLFTPTQSPEAKP